jgi:hypothetical protein
MSHHLIRACHGWRKSEPYREAIAAVTRFAEEDTEDAERNLRQKIEAVEAARIDLQVRLQAKWNTLSAISLALDDEAGPETTLAAIAQYVEAAFR